MSTCLPSMLISCSILLFILNSCMCTMADGRNQQRFHIVPMDTFVARGNCSQAKAAAAAAAEGTRRRNSTAILHRHGPCSSVPGRRVAETILHDKKRVEALHERMRVNRSRRRQPQATEGTLRARRGESLGTADYVVTIGVGTPAVNQTVIFDTGSDICWIQCLPCSRVCYPQQDVIFNASSSTSYREVSCDSAACNQLDPRGCADNGECVYAVAYADNSTTVGVFGQDTLTLSPGVAFDGFLFGCGQDNRGDFGRTAGIISLSRNTFSVILQTSELYGRVFSYCLPLQSSCTGALTFGGSGVGTSNSVSYTPMLTDERDPTLYALELTGISVGGDLLPIATTVFSTAGTIIDSGTVITRLPPAAYQALRSSFRRGMSEYTLGEPLENLLDTCYDLTGQTSVTVPYVALHFGGGATAELNAQGILFYADVSQVCLAFAANGDDGSAGIIGNAQQLGLEVVYDLAAGRIGFGTGTCC